MSIKVTYEAGETLDKCYFIAANEAGEKLPIRATHILDSKLHKVANEDTDDKEPKLEIQPTHFVQKFEALCPDLETFKKVAFAMALGEGNGVEVKAAKESDAPTMATEPMEKVKSEKEPIVAAEETVVADKVPTESAPEIRKYYGRLPGKASGKPEIALDLQSKLQATEGQLKAIMAENDELKKENEGMKKAGEAEKVLKLLSELGVAEDAKDKEAYTKKLSGLPEQAMGVLEGILKDVVEACKEDGGKEKPKAPFGGAPKPAMGGGMPPKKPEGHEPPLDSRANVIHANYSESGMSSVSDFANLWMKDNRSQELVKK